jgi:hypothetical protein
MGLILAQAAFPAENELVLLLLGIGILVFMAVNRSRLAELPSRGLFLAAFHVLVLGWVLTVLEGLFWPELLNTAEHACYAASSLMVAVWCWHAFVRRGEATP